MVTQRMRDIGGQRRFDSARLSLSMGVLGAVRVDTRAWDLESKVQSCRSTRRLMHVFETQGNPKSSLSWVVASFSWPLNPESGARLATELGLHE